MLDNLLCKPVGLKFLPQYLRALLLLGNVQRPACVNESLKTRIKSFLGKWNHWLKNQKVLRPLRHPYNTDRIFRQVGVVTGREKMHGLTLQPIHIQVYRHVETYTCQKIKLHKSQWDATSSNHTCCRQKQWCEQKPAVSSQPLPLPAHTASPCI